MKSYVIHLIRHGMTEANVKGQYVGVTDTPLCDEGKRKLYDLRENYEYPKVDLYYSSPLSRCVDTCKIIYPESEIKIVEDLRECNFGDYEGKTTKELSKDEGFLKWLESGQQIKPPNGESGPDFQKRVCKAFEGIVEEMMRSGTTSSAVFAHGGVIMLLLTAYSVPKSNFYDWIVDNGCGYSLRITPGLWMRSKVLEVYDKIPLGCKSEIEGDFKYLMETVKKAARKAYGTSEEV